ncbi:hypothetical protein TNCV_1110751 [Trichonephila clavipes]|nr:hypothetical protein TNCV_1110751 [Trichonephila clavipes]
MSSGAIPMTETRFFSKEHKTPVTLHPTLMFSSSPFQAYVHEDHLEEAYFGLFHLTLSIMLPKATIFASE